MYRRRGSLFNAFIIINNLVRLCWARPAERLCACTLSHIAGYEHSRTVYCSLQLPFLLLISSMMCLRAQPIRINEWMGKAYLLLSWCAFCTLNNKLQLFVPVVHVCVCVCVSARSRECVRHFKTILPHAIHSLIHSRQLWMHSIGREATCFIIIIIHIIYMLDTDTFP